MTPQSTDALWEQVSADDESVLDGMIELFETLINLIKSNGYDIPTVRRLNLGGIYVQPNSTLLSLLEPIFSAYCTYLTEHDEIDFNDMINLDRYVCIGNFSFDGIAGGDASGGSGSGSGSDNSSSGESTTSGIHFNLELNLLYDDNDGNGKRDRSYSKNAALDQLITRNQLENIIDIWNDDQFYNILHNNCAEIATKTWNKVSDYELDGFDIMYSPRQLKKSINKNDDSYSIEWNSNNWEKALNKEVIDW